MSEVETGVAAGVPYALRPPADRRPDAPVVVGWHLMDAPRTETAFAAALPLEGLDAWRIYLGLPMSGARALPEEEFMRLGYADAVLNIFGPVADAAVAEFPAAFAAIRAEFGIGGGPLGYLGGSMGAAVAGLLLAEGPEVPDAAVLVSPLLQLRPVVEANARAYAMTYEWSPASEAVADRIDLVARAGELGPTPVSLVVGAADDPDAALVPAAGLQEALPGSDLVVIEGMGHALAEEPGTGPAPQTTHAAQVDAHAVAWFRRHLAP